MAAPYQQNGVSPAPDPLTLQGGTWAYYLYDGPELGLVLQLHRAPAPPPACAVSTLPPRARVVQRAGPKLRNRLAF